MTERYIPLKAVANVSLFDPEYISYYKGKQSFLEFTFDGQQRKFYRLLLILANNYSNLQQKYLPPKSYEEGEVYFRSNCDIITDTFKVEIYSDGVKIILSNQAVTHIIKTDRIYFELGEDDTLIAISVTGMSPSEVQHTESELLALSSS